MNVPNFIINQFFSTNETTAPLMVLKRFKMADIFNAWHARYVQAYLLMSSSNGEKNPQHL
jgi:hypothetical protein